MKCGQVLEWLLNNRRVLLKGDNNEIRKMSVSLLNNAAYNPRLDLKPGEPEYEKLMRPIGKLGYKCNKISENIRDSVAFFSVAL